MTVTANIHEAKTTLSKLIERALAGEEVVIAKAGKPLVRLAALPQPAAGAGRLAAFDKYQGKVIRDEDWERSEFDEAMLERFYAVDEGQTLPNVAESGDPFADK
ncbi:MAG: type II toxin-antitoxin system Phd/YefM family antitoxin [Brevundimonas sp.]